MSQFGNYKDALKHIEQSEIKQFYYLQASKASLLRMIEEENIKYYDKTINARIKISKKNGYCCMIRGIPIFIAHKYV